MKFIVKLSILYFITLIGSSDLTAQGSRETDSLALIALYNATDGANWNNSWDLEMSIENWFGVSLDKNGRVDALFLSGQGLQGELPNELGNLSTLYKLNLGGNMLTGTIPTVLGQLTDLLDLNLSRNQFSGEIPDELMALNNLDILYLDANHLEGSIPPEIVNLNQLSILSFSSNRLSGDIPSFLGDLTSLTRLNLAENLFSATIPTELGNLTNLTHLSLNGNNLEGEVPVELGDLINLTYLSLNRNRLEGEVPLGFTNLTKLTYLNLSDNAFTGFPDFSQISTLSRFEVANNLLDFGDLIPNESLFALDSYYSPQGLLNTPVSVEAFSGQEINMSVETSDDGNNRYQWYKDGSLIEGATQLVYQFKYSGVDQDGTYYAIVENEEFPTLRLRRSNYYVNIDQAQKRIGDSLALVALYEATNGSQWAVPWDLESSMNSWEGITMNGDRVIEVNVSGNNLTGELPPAIENLSELRLLVLSDNNLSGSVPEELWSLRNLTSLWLDRNQLTGPLTPKVSELNDLEGLAISDNQFGGTIPLELGSLPYLRFLNLNQNQFSGHIPSELGNLANLEFLFVSRNRLTGNVSRDLGNLKKLVAIDLYDNYLTGSIPMELGEISGLVNVEFSRNQFSGSIPKSFDQLNLEYFFIYDNFFDSIPILNGDNLKSFYAWGNLLSSEDIIPNLLVTRQFYYDAQKEYGETLSLSPDIGENIELNSDGKMGSHPNNIYKWYKDGSEILGAGNSSYSFIYDGTQDGKYHLAVINSEVYGQLVGKEIYINQNAPEEITLSNDNVDENEPDGTFVGKLSTVGGTAPYNYGFFMNTGFFLKGDSLFTDSYFDAEHKEDYKIIIEVTDANDFKGEQLFYIKINGINEHASTGVVLSNLVIEEKQPAGTFIGTLNTLDEDVNDVYSYTLSGDNASKFHVFRDSLFSAEVFNFETQSEYLITVTSTDQGDLSIAQDFVILISDVLEDEEIEPLIVGKSEELIVYPNPSADEITIQGLNGDGMYITQVIDLSGKIQLKSKNKVVGGCLKLDISTLPPGAYTISVSDGRMTENGRIVKQ